MFIFRIIKCMSNLDITNIDLNIQVSIDKEGLLRESGFLNGIVENFGDINEHNFQLDKFNSYDATGNLNKEKTKFNISMLLNSIKEFVELQNLIKENNESSSVPFKEDEKTGFTDATPEIFNSLNKKHIDFIQSHSLKHVLNLVHLANYLQMDALVDLINLFIAMYIKQILYTEGSNAPKKIRELFGIKYTFKDSEEEKRITEENNW